MTGVARIFLYNWPTYVATWASALVVVVLASRLGSLAGLVELAALVAIAWSLVSLLVSYWVYDRSALVAGTWLRPLLPTRLETWSAIDTGLDAEVMLDEVIPGRCLARLDLYDGDTVRAPSVRRARALTPRAHVAVRAHPRTLPLPDESCDLVTAVFAAHEVRDPGLREALFGEAKRVLRVGGRLIVVEHVRDLANFLAFGPGYTHFQPRGEWLRLASHAGLAIAAEIRVTPFVMALALEKNA